VDVHLALARLQQSTVMDNRCHPASPIDPPIWAVRRRAYVGETTHPHVGRLDEATSLNALTAAMTATASDRPEVHDARASGRSSEQTCADRAGRSRRVYG
jgi:hypothetical protein